MPDKRSKFHEFALKSILFKGREDWYFCYLKAEKIAHVLAILEQRAEGEYGERVREIATRAAGLPGDIAHLAAGEVDATVVLADVFALLSAVRLAGTEEVLHRETVVVLEAEYEAVAERLVRGSHPSPFVGVEDFALPPLTIEAPQRPLEDTRLSQNVFERPIQKDMGKGQVAETYKRHSDRTDRILDVVRKNGSVSIKDIAAVVRGCSEKTIQRELTLLIQQGLVRRVGERRWSHYRPA